MKLKAYMRPFYVLFLCLFFANSFAQKQRLIVGGSTPGLYIDYKVGPNETFASIASIYNISPDSLSEFNNIDYYEGKLFAKSLKVPLIGQNFTQQGVADSGQSLVPVYFVANYNQSIEQLSSKVNKVPVSSLKKWNTVPATGIVKGMPVMIGFLKAKPDMLSYFEDTVSTDFAKIETPGKLKNTRKTNTVATENKTAVAANTKTKVDGAATTGNSKKVITKKEPVKKVAVADTTNAIAAITPVPASKSKTKNVKAKSDTAKAISITKVDSAKAVAVTKKNTRKPVVTKQKIDKIVDTTAVAASTPATPVTPNVEENKSREAKVDEHVIVVTEVAPEKPVVEDNKEPVKTDDAIAAVVPENKVDTNATSTNQEAVVENKVEEKPATDTAANVDASASNLGNVENEEPENENNFSYIFKKAIADKPEKHISGEASFFESQTGWKDKKYYVLIPNIAPGTIVKISSIDNHSVFAMVLGNMPDMEENDGILLRMSNAAVAALGIKNEKFPVVVTYY